MTSISSAKLACVLALLVAVPSAASAAPDDPAPICTGKAGDLPRPRDRQGLPDPAIPIDHVIVMMQENHSFDNVLGKLNDPRYYGDELDGIKPGMFNADSQGRIHEPFHLGRLCVKDMTHSWWGSHAAWNEGRNDSFVKVNESSGDAYRVMGYYDEREYPLMYFLADHYAVADRFFSSVMGPTHPNRFYLYAGTSFGHTNNHLPNFLEGGWTQKTIFDALNEAGVSWRFYYTDYSNVMLFTRMFKQNIRKFEYVSHFAKDARENRLPQVVFVENSTLMGDEHPPFTMQTNQRAIARQLKALMESPSWPSSAVFLTYDEGGGNFDHVPPPRACEPDSAPGPKFDRYGFRVPGLVISPWAKRHHVSHRTYDHTSILRFIETKFNVPALSGRDANADAMLDMFDFSHPDFARVDLPETPVQADKLVGCFLHKGYRD